MSAEDVLAGILIGLRDRPCPVCRAQAGEPCRRPNGDRYITVRGTPKFHVKRGAQR